MTIEAHKVQYIKDLFFLSLPYRSDARIWNNKSVMSNVTGLNREHLVVKVEDCGKL
jgi:hypothetical protein